MGDSLHKIGRGGVRAAVDPIGGTKQSLEGHKEGLDDISGKTRARKEAQSAKEIAEEQRAMQRTALAQLDQEENRRIKKILAGGRGTRSYRGGPMFRTRAGDRAGGGGLRTAAGTGSAALNAEAMREGGARGGKRDYYSSLL